MIYRFLIFCLLTTTGLSAQIDSTSRNVPQFSYGLNLYNLGEEGDWYWGGSVDAEARLHRNMGLLFTVGRSLIERSSSWDGLPLDTLAGAPLPPNWPSVRQTGTIMETLHRTYLGAGAQFSLPIGSGEIALAGLLTLGRTGLRQVGSYGRIVATTPDGPPTGLTGTATVDYQAVWSLSGRLHLHYTYWFSHHLALRVGLVADNLPLAVWGNYIEEDRSRFRVRDITYEGAYRLGVENYTLPEQDRLTTPDPTDLGYNAAAQLGIIYKPTRNGQR